ncbi:hypothetical protein SeMB42_g04455 [Synchytrium endobioticum]|nr:hypothetical protein SeMB42_g04455 [Synchytrium endobioticum]
MSIYLSHASIPPPPPPLIPSPCIPHPMRRHALQHQQKRGYPSEALAQKNMQKKLAIKFPLPVKHIPPAPATRLPTPAATSPDEYQARLYAFVARAGLHQFRLHNTNGRSTRTLVRALTHRSYKGPIPIRPDASVLPAMTPLPPDAVNDRYTVLGDAILRMYLTEWIAWRYKNLSGDDIEAAVDAYIGVAALAKIGRSLGVQRVMRWKYTGAETAVGETPVISSIVQSLIGLLYESVSPKTAKEFIRAHITSRAVDLGAIVKMQKPKALLSQVFRLLSRERPVARLLKETGRQSHAPVFVVGMYSGETKVGEGYGSSLKMAETRAAKDALLVHFLKESRDVTIPSDMNEESITFMVDKADLGPAGAATTSDTAAETSP